MKIVIVLGRFYKDVEPDKDTDDSGDEAGATKMMEIMVMLV